MWFSPYLAIGCGRGGGGGGPPKGLVHKLLMLFFTLGSSKKIGVSEIYFLDIATTENDHPIYVKHVLGRIYVVFTLFGYWVRLGGGGHNSKFSKLIFLIL